MRSSVRSGIELGRELHRPVWLNLSVLLPRPPGGLVPSDGPQHLALDTTAEVPAVLLHWLRGAAGEWLAVVSYPIGFADGRGNAMYQERQLVPASVVRPRRYGSYRDRR